MSLPMPRVWDGTSFSKRIHPFSCSVSKTLKPLSTVNMVLPPMDEISVLDMVEIKTPDGDVQYFRVANISTDENSGEKSVYLEHGACTLEDYIIPTDVQKTDTITNLLTYMLGFQSKWVVGTVQATDTIYMDLGGLSLLDSITNMMESIPGYQCEFVQTASAWRVDIKQRPTTVVCEGRLNRNLQSCDISYTTSGLCTRVYAEGLANGKMDSANISTYGVHEEIMTLNESLSDAQKNAIVTAYLAAHDHPAISIAISAVELAQITGLTIDDFKVGTVCRIAIPKFGVVENEVIIEKRYSDIYAEPENVTITLANATPDLSISVAAIAKTGAGTKNDVRKGNQRYNTHFEQTDEYFRLIATDTEWDELEHGTVTAYGQIVLTSNSFQAVVSAIGKDGTITAASIGLAISAEGSNAYITADHIKLTGDTTIAGMMSVDGDTLVIKGGVSGDGTLQVNTAECRNIEIDSDMSCYTAMVSELIVDGNYADWQSKQVITSINITMPTVNRSTGHYFLYTDTYNSLVPDGQLTGYIITSYTAGNVAPPTTDTIYYLGSTTAPNLSPSNNA